MKKRAFVVSALALFAAVAVCYAAADAFIGSWKLNEAKSKVSAGMTKNTMVVYTVAGDSVKVTTDGTDGDGKPLHTEWTGKYDGKDYPATGDPTTDTRAYTKVGTHTLSITSRKNGKVVNTIRVVVSADGKTRTVTTTATDAKGMKSVSTSVYDRQ
jgi:hypothetical protein